MLDLYPLGKERIDRMVSGAENALRFVLSLKEKDRLLIITDNDKEAIGRAFESGARRLGASVTSYLLPEYKTPLSEIPEDLNPLFCGCHVFVNAFSSHAEETPFRIKLVKHQQSLGARVGHAPGIKEDMMLKGLMTADYEQVVENARNLIEAYKGASKVHIITKEGTDIMLSIND